MTILREYAVFRGIYNRSTLPSLIIHTPNKTIQDNTQGDGVKTLMDELRDDTQPQPMTDKRSTHRLQDPEYMGTQMGWVGAE